jgi:hypothetical protein
MNTRHTGGVIALVSTIRERSLGDPPIKTEDPRIAPRRPI